MLAGQWNEHQKSLLSKTWVEWAVLGSEPSRSSSGVWRALVLLAGYHGHSFGKKRGILKRVLNANKPLWLTAAWQRHLQMKLSQTQHHFTCFPCHILPSIPKPPASYPGNGSFCLEDALWLNLSFLWWQSACTRGLIIWNKKPQCLQTWLSVNIILCMNWRESLDSPLRRRAGGIEGVVWVPAELRMTNERLCCVLILLCLSAFEPHLLFIPNKAHISHLSPVFQETCSGPLQFVAYPERLKSFPEDKILSAFFHRLQFGMYLIRDGEIVKASNTIWAKAKTTDSNRSFSELFVSRWILKSKYSWSLWSNGTTFLDSFWRLFTKTVLNTECKVTGKVGAKRKTKDLFPGRSPPCGWRHFDQSFILISLLSPWGVVFIRETFFIYFHCLI